MECWPEIIVAGLALTVCFPECGVAEPALSFAQCGPGPQPPFCAALSGSRAEGWLPQSRSEVFAQHGLVVTSQPLAAQAGLRMLMRGGNAIDAAVATSAVLSVVEPMMVGVASDLFAMVYIAKEQRLYVLNASGVAPSGTSVERFGQLGYQWDPIKWGPTSGLPFNGILTVTVPGTAWGWEALLRRFGTMSFKEVLEPAVDYAEKGFPVSERIASDWHLPNAMPLRACCKELDPDSIKTWYVDGKPPVPGQIFVNRDLARTLRLLQQQGADAFYRGEIAKAIVAKSNALGGSMTLEDLASYRGEWIDPVVTTFRGVELVELPPPSQAWAANEMLNILEECVPGWAPGQTLATMGPAHPKYWHLLVEAKKLAYTDLYKYNADPRFASVPVAKLLSREHAASLCGKVNPNRASATPGPSGAFDGVGDTVVLSVADAEGNMVSWVNSNFDEFGSGITVPGYGFVLPNRGALFTLDPKSPNVIAPGKLPFNTLAAGFVMRGGSPLMTLTLMGGDMQAQGHAQALVNIFELGANLQAASDMARFRHAQRSNTLFLESALYDKVGAQLSAMGHTVKSANGADLGGFQSIMLTPGSVSTTAPTGSGRRVDGYYRAGSDHRKDGQAVGW